MEFRNTRIGLEKDLLKDLLTFGFRDTTAEKERQLNSPINRLPKMESSSYGGGMNHVFRQKNNASLKSLFLSVSKSGLSTLVKAPYVP